MAGVRFENITCRYGNHVVLSNFSLEVKESEIMGIVGPSGCGKTTLMRALCGFMKPETGNIYLDDRLVYSASKHVNIAPELRGIGVVFQDYAVWPHLSVWDNVCYPLKRHKVPKGEIEKRAAHALEQVLHRTHVFTHVEWDMRCYMLRCAAAPEGDLHWVTREALAGEIALPTAFRMFRDIE